MRFDEMGNRSGKILMLLPFLVYCLIGAAMTAFFSLKVFEHPTSDLMKLGARIAQVRKDNNGQA